MGRSSDRRTTALVCLALMVAACGSTGRSAPPEAAASESSATPVASAPATDGPPVTARPPTPPATPGPLPIETAVDELEGGIHLTPTTDGGVVVALPAPTGTALITLDADGRVMPGWPTSLDNAMDCSMASTLASDGSVRLVCLGPLDEAVLTAWAVDADGAVLVGWPATIPAGWVAATGVVGDDFIVLTMSADIADDPATGLPIRDMEQVMIAKSGEVTHAKAVRTTAKDWTIGPDGSVVGAGGIRGTLGDATRSELVAIEGGAARPGWPVHVDGFASQPSIQADGSILVSVGWHEESRTRVLGFDRDGLALLENTPDLTMSSLRWETESSESPRAPVAVADGTIYAYSDLDELVVYGLEGDGTVLDGWPYRSTGSLSRPGFCPPSSDLGCAFDPTPPVVGTTDIVLSLASWGQDGHGALVALDRRGGVRDGWPITLRRDGAEFWALARSAQDVTFAVAVEPEAGGGSSATVLAVEPDSTVRWRTTVAESG